MIDNEYKKCNTNWNKTLFLIGYPWLATLIGILIIFILYIILSFMNLTEYGWVLNFVFILSYWGFLITSMDNQINVIKKDCYKYGQDIIIKRTPSASAAPSAPIYESLENNK